MATEPSDISNGTGAEAESNVAAMSEKPNQDGTLTANGEPKTDRETPAKQETDAREQQGGDEGNSKKSGPEGGFSNTPIPNPPPGTTFYTLKITMHRATNLIMGDMETFSSDPYVLAQLNTDIPTRHKEDPFLRFRSFTVRKTTEPQWNEKWVVANVPSSGFKLKLRIYDEDPNDHDDLLGKVHITVPSLSDDWSGIKEQPYKLSLKQSSKRAVFARGLAACFRMVDRKLQGEVFVSIENLGKTGEDGQNGRAYTVGECRWFLHHSPMLGRITHTKDFSDRNGRPSSDQKKQIGHYNFQANQMQLKGPVPAGLYHRFVEFKPWVKRMFTTTGWQGVILGKALHHQHSRVYNFGRNTLCGHFPQGPSEEMTKKFLELVHYDQGGRIFTYVLTLDALWRFTETGKEFGIDMLSKHTMHSDVSIYIAFSGEFFIRRLRHRHHPPPPHSATATSPSSPHDGVPNDTHPPHDIEGGPPHDDPPTDPSYYELIIDNDSGTYRPNAQMLPQLASFLSGTLPGLHIRTLDCQADEEEMGRLKSEQRERKKHEGDPAVYVQDDDARGDDGHSRRSSVSSSDAEDLDRRRDAYTAPAPAAGSRRKDDFLSGDGANPEHGTTRALARDFKMQNAARWDKVRHGHGSSRDDAVPMAQGEDEQPQQQ